MLISGDTPDVGKVAEGTMGSEGAKQVRKFDDVHNHVRELVSRRMRGVEPVTHHGTSLTAGRQSPTIRRFNPEWGRA